MKALGSCDVFVQFFLFLPEFTAAGHKRPKFDSDDFAFLPRLAMAKLKNGKRNKNGNSSKTKRSIRSRGQQVLGQGTAAITKSGFGGGNRACDMRVFNAKLPHHWPLPRPVGPYTIVRTTRRFSSNASTVFGTFRFQDGASWVNICSIGDVVLTDPINATNNAFTRTYSGLSSLGAAATVVPSAFTVQIMNPNALQTTAGIAYFGVLHTQAKIAGDARTWQEYFDQFVQFQSPRILSAGKLALRGVECSSFPLNMSSLSDFEPLEVHSDATFTYGSADMETNGMAPILFYNPPGGPDYEFLVTTEWRVRFDLSNPAAASHRDHGVSSDFWLARLLRQATSMGNGVIEIADAVADAGQMARRMLPAARPLLALAN